MVGETSLAVVLAPFLPRMQRGFHACSCIVPAQFDKRQQEVVERYTLTLSLTHLHRAFVGRECGGSLAAAATPSMMVFARVFSASIEPFAIVVLRFHPALHRIRRRLVAGWPDGGLAFLCLWCLGDRACQGDAKSTRSPTVLFTDPAHPCRQTEVAPVLSPCKTFSVDRCLFRPTRHFGSLQDTNLSGGKFRVYIFGELFTLLAYWTCSCAARVSRESVLAVSNTALMFCLAGWDAGFQTLHFVRELDNQ